MPLHMQMVFDSMRHAQPSCGFIQHLHSLMTLSYPRGIAANRQQFIHQLVQVFLVGLTLGVMRTVVPALAETEFGVVPGSFLLLSSFVIAFGVVKGALNFVAGRLAEQWGRQRVLVLGWIAALPVPFLILWAPSWGWIVFATVLLGINQGMCWSMTQTAKMDITRPQERGLTMGLNEFSGYVGVAIAGVLSGYFAMALGPRLGLWVLGLMLISLALLLALFAVRETLPWAQAESTQQAQNPGGSPPDFAPLGNHPSTLDVFLMMSWRDRRMAAFSQAGLVEKFVDALVWVLYPVFLVQQGLSLGAMGWVVGIYGIVWGAAQLVTGPLSDRIGRLRPIVWGMWLAGCRYRFGQCRILAGGGGHGRLGHAGDDVG